MITLITGQVGSGKTFHAVEMVLDGLKEGRNVFTNIQMRAGKIDAQKWKGKLYQFRDPVLEKGDKPFCEEDGLMQREGDSATKEALIVVDEATYWFPPGKCPEDVHRFLHRQRHSGIDIVLVCPDAQALPAAIRRLVQYHLEIVDWANSVEKIIPFVNPPPLRMKKTRSGFMGPCVSMIPFTINATLAEYYDTTGGTYGMEPLSTSKREVKERAKKGWKALVQFSIGVGAFLAIATWTLSRIFSGGIFPTPPKIEVAEDTAKPSIEQPPPAPLDFIFPTGATYIGGTATESLWQTADGRYFAIDEDRSRPPTWFADLESATAWTFSPAWQTGSRSEENGKSTPTVDKLGDTAGRGSRAGASPSARPITHFYD